ncbi:MAG: flagellar motor protein MotB [Thermoleophilia bacterium]
MARKKKQHHEEHADERWLVTYADMLTLMFVLFMVLFSISVVNTGKFDQLKESLSKAFNPGIFPGGPSVLQQGATQAVSPVVDTPATSVTPTISAPMGINLTNSSAAKSLEQSQLQHAQDQITKAVKAAHLQKLADTKIDERGLHIQLKTDPFLFAPGSADLHPLAITLLRPIAGTLKSLSNPISVEGNTDSTPIHTVQYPSNRILGSARACTVLDVLNQYGVPHSSRNACATYGADNPIVDNATPAHRAQNRRVEIVVVRQSAGG